MEMKTQVTVLGAKFFKGDLEGQKHDFTKLFVQMPVSENETDSYGSCGFNVVEMKYGTSEEYPRIKSFSLPAVLDVTLRLTTKGYEITGVKLPTPARAA